jgi:hypothetical protein
VQVAVVAVEVVKGSVDEVVDVVAVRDRRVAAPWPVPGGALDRGAAVRVSLVHREDVLLDPVVFR